MFDVEELCRAIGRVVSPHGVAIDSDPRRSRTAAIDWPWQFKFLSGYLSLILVVEVIFIDLVVCFLATLVDIRSREDHISRVICSRFSCL